MSNAGYPSSGCSQYHRNSVLPVLKSAVMTDIANSMNASTATSADSGQIVPSESSESVLSPGVREAMDLIFPKSATQLLQRGLSFDEDVFLGVKTCKENMHPSVTAAPTSVVNSVALPCSVTSAHITTVTTTNTAMAASSEVVNSVYENRFPIVSLSPVMSADSTPVILPNSESKDDGKDLQPESKGLPIELPKRPLAKIRISKADLEIISSHDTLDDESEEKTSASVNSVDLSSSDCHSICDSDSEDMRRPFVSIIREKKKQKKKKKKMESNSEQSNSLKCEVTVKSGQELKTSSEPDEKSDPPSTNSSDGSIAVLQKDYVSSTKELKQNSRQESSNDNLIENNLNMNSEGGNTQSWNIKNGSLSKGSFNTYSGTISEEVSNISFSSTKENELNDVRKSKQRLPEIKQFHFNIRKQKDKIRNAFPPCFVVVKNIHPMPFRNLMKGYIVADSVLPLSVRLKNLSDLCDKGSISCKMSKKVEEFVYRNIFEETVLPGTSDDEFENSRGRRNLRKRDKHISYVEPSEDDILDEYSRKRHRSKHKDSAARSEDEGSGESKKRKKQNVTDSVTVALDRTTLITVNPSQDSSSKIKTAEKDTEKINEINKTKVTQDKTKTKSKDGKKCGPNEIIVYPRTSLGSSNSYYFRVDGKNVLTSNAAEKSKHISSSKEKDKNVILVTPPSTSISVLPTSTLSGAFTRHANPVSLFSSLPLSFAAQPLVCGAPISTPMISTAGGSQKSPQFCLVKMDGKDVLLQLVPSSGVGVPVVVTKGKTLIVPPVPLVQGSSHLFGQPVQQTFSITTSTQAVPTLLTSVVPSSQGNMATAAPLHSLIGMPVMSRPVGTSSQSLSALSTMSTTQLTGLTSTARVRPLNFATLRTYSSQSSADGLSATVNVMSSANSGASSVVVSAESTRTLPGADTPMAAPNTTTVVRSVRMPVPNQRAAVPDQSASLRSIRIFVPGCSATGIPNRYTTIASFANNSPLSQMATSSTLLPERKHSTDQELTPEQRAAKRRKLEKKYPLPPGVVIKTESLDTVSEPSTVITTGCGSRSLLSQNVHLISTSRPGSGFQNFQIINPSLTGALTLRNVRGSSNIIYRAASIGGGQTILLPTSVGHIATVTTTAVTTTSQTTPSCTSSSLEPTTVSANVATATTTTDAACTNATALATTDLLSSARTLLEVNPSPPALTPLSHLDNPSPPTLTPVSQLDNPSPPALTPVPNLQGPENISTDMLVSTSGSTVELLETDTSSSSTSVVALCESSVTKNDTVTSFTSLVDTSGEPSPNSNTTVTVNSKSNGNPELPPAKSPEAVTLASLRNSLEGLRKMIQIQEARGLKGDRLEKLKELLLRKEEHYRGVQKLAIVKTSLFSSSEANGDVTIVDDGEENSINLDEPGGSETDPFVID